MSLYSNMAWHIAMGLHSNIPPCCIAYCILEEASRPEVQVSYQDGTESVSERELLIRELRETYEISYHPCDKCLAERTFQSLHHCHDYKTSELELKGFISNEDWEGLFNYINNLLNETHSWSDVPDNTKQELIAFWKTPYKAVSAWTFCKELEANGICTFADRLRKKLNDPDDDDNDTKYQENPKDLPRMK